MNRILKLALAALVALIPAVVVASPAQAVGPCSVGWICFYDTSVSLNPLAERDVEDTNTGECYQMNSTQNNRTSYIVNRANWAWRVYDTNNCTGASGYIYENSSGGMNSTWNNVISSYKLL